MNHSKFSLADLFTVLAAIGFGFFCFLSLNFLSLGETVPSIIWAAGFAFVLGSLALGAKALKRTSRNFKACIVGEWVLLFLFIVVACVAVFPFSHYFSVSTQKGEIQQKMTANIAQVERMFSDYEKYTNNRLIIYENKLKSIVVGKKVNRSEYRKYGFVAGTDDNTQIENKIFTLRAQLYPSHYEEMKQVSTDWLASSKATVSTWKPIGIVTVISKIENNFISWREQLKGFSAFRASGEIATDYEYEHSFDDVTDRLTILGSPTLLSILCVGGLYVLMLLSYFISKRHPRYPGLKEVFGMGSTNANEL